jgi:hypothetical protein
MKPEISAYKKPVPYMQTSMFAQFCYTSFTATYNTTCYWYIIYSFFFLHVILQPQTKSCQHLRDVLELILSCVPSIRHYHWCIPLRIGESRSGMDSFSVMPPIPGFYLLGQPLPKRTAFWIYHIFNGNRKKINGKELMFAVYRLFSCFINLCLLIQPFDNIDSLLKALTIMVNKP